MATRAQQKKLIDALAEYFSGQSVTTFSAALDMMSGPFCEQAKRFFVVRTAMGISGWASEEEAARNLCIGLGIRCFVLTKKRGRVTSTPEEGNTCVKASR